MAKVVKIKYVTPDKLKLVNPINIEHYNKYLKSNIIKNNEVEDTTYKVYQSNFNCFLVFLMERYNNIDLYSDEFMSNAVDIMEDYIEFLQVELQNNKKTINNKIASISSFYIWSVQRRHLDRHPFDKILIRMKNYNEEKILHSYFLSESQINKIEEELKVNEEYDIIDRLLFSLLLDSANRIGAISKLNLHNLDVDNKCFTNIREKRGYRVEVPFTDETLNLIKEYLLKRESMDNFVLDAFWINKYNGEYRPITTRTLQNRMQRIGKIVGIEDLNPHSIRKTRLNLIYEKTGDITLSADLANHKSIETTKASYIKPKTKSDVMNRIKELLNKQ